MSRLYSWKCKSRYIIISQTYELICDDLSVEKSINEINILEKAARDYDVVHKQYKMKSTELFEQHYKNKR